MSDQTPPPPPAPPTTSSAAPPPPPPPLLAPAAPVAPPLDLTPYLAPSPALSPADEKLWATIIHVVSISGGWVTSLVGYLVFRDRGPFVRLHTVNALNFHLTMLIGMAAGYILSLVIIGFLVILAVFVLVIVFGILAAQAAHRGQYYKYPIAITFVR